MKKLITLATSILFSFSLYACEDVNFYDNHPTINDLKIVNQGNLNICYAHTLSTIYNLEFAQAGPQKLNPFWLAFIHKDRWFHWQPKKMDYSLLTLAWADLKKNGYCEENNVQIEIDRLRSGAPYSDDQLFFLLSRFFKYQNRKTKTESGFIETTEKLLKKIKNKYSDFERPWKIEEIRQVLNPIKTEASGKIFFDWLKQRVFKSCRDNANQFPHQILVSTARMNEKNHELAWQVEHLLKQGKPVSVGYCWEIFKNHKYQNELTPRLLKLINLKCGAHYSAIVGSRKTANSCDYLVRNSFGKGFWAEPHYQCWCKDNSTGESRNCQKSEESNTDLEVLGCWVDRDKLLSNTFDLSFFK